MRVKFSNFERVAGLFVIIAIAGFLVALVVVAFEKGWFESKVELTTSFPEGGGLFPGMAVQISGLRAGTVSDVILEENNTVTVHFLVAKRYFARIRENSVVRTIRPFLIGDKALDISIGSPSVAPAVPGQILASEESIDLMDVVGGRRMTDGVQMLSKLAGSLKYVLDAFADPKRTKNMVKMFDELAPLLSEAQILVKGLVLVSDQLNTDKRLGQTLSNTVKLTGDLNKIVPEVIEIAKKSPETAGDLIKIIENLSKLSADMAKILPAISDLAPELPRASRRAIEALDEAVVTIKAMQKSFLLSGKVEEVREEEKRRGKERVPASGTP